MIFKNFKEVPSINIVILGATGRVGGHVLKNVLQGEHNVTALVRQPLKIIPDQRLTLINGNVLNKEDIAKALSGIQVVISALSTDGTTTLSDSMHLILEEMKKQMIKRIITVGTSGILQSQIDPGLLRYQSKESKRKSTGAAEEHHKVFRLLSESNVQWTIICPPKLTNGIFTGCYRIKRDILPQDGKAISISDVADAVCKQILCTDHLKTRIGIAY
ncbi:NAD(P)-dependent oxidoreductase [Desulfosporosinus sp. SB140]|uniref:NAD(P)-dependent oxidoreductase n=1 Tax=Desulfosporosinus paludis TaxID=3115649 RepID=UPI00388E1B80